MSNGLLLLTIVILVLISCSNMDVPLEDDIFNYTEFMIRFQYQRELWESNNIDHYQFYCQMNEPGNPGSHLLVDVFPDKEPEWMFLNPDDAKWDAEKGFLRDKENLFPPLKGSTISELYSSLESFITQHHVYLERPDNNGTTLWVDANYNDDYSYPVSVLITYKTTHGHFFDGAWSFSITWFEDLREK